MSSGLKRAPESFRPQDNLAECVSVIVLGAVSPKKVLKNPVDYTANRNAMISAMTEMAKKQQSK